MNSEVMQKPSERGGGLVMESDFIRVVFQNGLPSDVGVNGCRVENVLELALQRLAQYQSGPLACLENDEAIADLRHAIQALELRRLRRQEQGVLNTMTRHETVRTEDEVADFSATGA